MCAGVLPPQQADSGLAGDPGPRRRAAITHELWGFAVRRRGRLMSLAFCLFGQTGPLSGRQTLAECPPVEPSWRILPPPYPTPASQHRARRGPLTGLGLVYCRSPRGSAALHPGLPFSAPEGARCVAFCFRCVLTRQPRRGVRNQVTLAGGGGAIRRSSFADTPRQKVRIKSTGRGGDSCAKLGYNTNVAYSTQL